MSNRIKEWISIQLAKRPGRVVLIGILLFNIFFILVSALLINALSLSKTESMGYFEAAYYTITMILDAGSISAVVDDIGTSGVAVVITCLVVILVGMIAFTGAVIGYVTNWISGFISNANTGYRKLRISNHMVILNWNTRASEIINDLLYTGNKEKVVVLVNSRKEEIQREIHERISDTIAKENELLRNNTLGMTFLRRKRYIRNNKLKNNVTYIVREGDVFSLKQLRDIQLQHAKAVVILGDDINGSQCKFADKMKAENLSRGNSHTIKTLMQVADITASEKSDDNQKIVVEITDLWTQSVVEKIIRSKQVDEKCNIVPIYINRVLGQLLSQFSLMPELNLVYRELFSYKGGTFCSQLIEVVDDDEFIKEYMQTHKCAIPLASFKEKDQNHFFFVADHEKNIDKTCERAETEIEVDLNYAYWIEKKNVIVLGHNSDTDELMKGFLAFTCEWKCKNPEDEILRVTMVDEQSYLEKMNYYTQYPFVKETVIADIYDKDRICDTINRVISYSEEDTSILILSDDTALKENIDANALANLIYVQDIIKDKFEEDENFDPKSIDVIVEIVDPKHHDIVNGYDINNVVISNRYISKMITQIGEKEAIYNFYTDLLTYDTTESDGYESKEVYAKKVSTFFNTIPQACSADELIRAVYKASVLETLPVDKHNPTIVIGYVKKNGDMKIFSGDLSQIKVKLEADDKIIVYSTH